MKMNLIEQHFLEGNAPADLLAKEGADLDGGALATIKAPTFRQEGMEVHASLQYATTFHCWVEKRQNCDELEPKPMAICSVRISGA